MMSKVFRNPSQTTMGFENFGEGYVGYLKITEDKAINADLAHTRVTLQLKTRVSG